MQIYDLGLAWNWPYDDGFVRLLEAACQRQGVTIYQITPYNLQETLHALIDGRLSFRSLLDRATDTDQYFQPLILWARQQGILRINPFRRARRAWNKAVMHQKIVCAGIDTPATIIIPSYLEEHRPLPPALTSLGECFAIKPAHGGGGKGVKLRAARWDQVLAARLEYPSDQYLLQAHVTPILLDGRPAWFRLIYCAGQIFPCWWDQNTHRYEPLCDPDLLHYRLYSLLNISNRIASLCQLELFSSEIAYTGGRFLVIDYVNDPIDLRLQSKCYEGVPDPIVEAVARGIASYVAVCCHLRPHPVYDFIFA